MDLSADEPLRDFADRAVRDALLQPENLRECLRLTLPELADGFVCEQARLLNREFPLDDWRGRESDLLFEIPFRAGDETVSILVCLLLEHQSRPDPLMPLRTLLYATLYWERQWKEWEQRPRPKAALRLTRIIHVS